MGVALQFRGSTGSFKRLQGQTEELVEWISKVRIKKIIVRKQQKNLRIEAILGSALSRAENELRMKQQQRYKRWQLLKMELYKTNIDVCNPEHEHVQSLNFDDKTCEDINSLNYFMSMLNQVKISPQR